MPARPTSSRGWSTRRRSRTATRCWSPSGTRTARRAAATSTPAAASRSPPSGCGLREACARAGRARRARAWISAAPPGVTHLIVTSCTGFSRAGLDLELVERCGLDPSVERTMVGFMGCYAAINALKLARHIVRSEPAARVLIVNLELCTLHLQESDEPRAAAVLPALRRRLRGGAGQRRAGGPGARRLPRRARARARAARSPGTSATRASTCSCRARCRRAIGRGLRAGAGEHPGRAPRRGHRPLGRASRRPLRARRRGAALGAAAGARSRASREVLRAIRQHVVGDRPLRAAAHAGARRSAGPARLRHGLRARAHRRDACCSTRWPHDRDASTSRDAPRPTS